MPNRYDCGNSAQEGYMPGDIQISFRGMATSPSVKARVRHRAEELQRLSDRVTACRVTLEAAHRRHRQGTIYHVSIELAVPGGKIVVNREPGENHAHEDMHVAVRDAFDAARRQLQDHMRRLDGQTKRHEAPSVGHIALVSSPSETLPSWRPRLTRRYTLSSKRCHLRRVRQAEGRRPRAVCCR